MAAAGAAEAKRLAQQVFQDADKNKNGFLTKSEIRKYFKKHSEEKNRILGADFRWNEFFTAMDKNGDNQFDVIELTNFLISSSADPAPADDEEVDDLAAEAEALEAEDGEGDIDADAVDDEFLAEFDGMDDGGAVDDEEFDDFEKEMEDLDDP